MVCLFCEISKSKKTQGECAVHLFNVIHEMTFAFMFLQQEMHEMKQNEYDYCNTQF